MTRSLLIMRNKSRKQLRHLTFFPSFSLSTPLQSSSTSSYPAKRFDLAKENRSTHRHSVVVVVAATALPTSPKGSTSSTLTTTSTVVPQYCCFHFCDCNIRHSTPLPVVFENGCASVKFVVPSFKLTGGPLKEETVLGLQKSKKSINQKR
jgi:hypothetical protein